MSLRYGCTGLLILLMAGGGAVPSHGQTGRLEGRVVEAETEEGLPGVSVGLEGTSMGAVTAEDGTFQIEGAPPRDVVATASLPVPPVPTAVWVVIALFAVLMIGVVGAWLVVARRTARRRGKGEGGPAPSAARPALVTADLPTAGSS